MNMKCLLAGSLGLNVLFLGVEAYLVRKDPGDLSSLPPLVVCVPPGEVDPVGELGTGDAAPKFEPSPSYAIATIESADFEKYVAHLRSLGCPNETIRNIIVTDVNEAFRHRLKNQDYTASRFSR